MASFDRYCTRQPIGPSGINKEELASQWLAEVFYPIIESVPANLAGRVEPAQIFHEVLENRWFLSEQRGFDVGLETAAKTYFQDILPFRHDAGVSIK